MQAAYNLGDDGDVLSSSANDWLSSLTSIAQTAQSIEQQNNLNQINLSRAQQGLPPINTAAYASGADSGIVPVQITPMEILVGLGILILLIKH